MKQKMVQRDQRALNKYRVDIIVTDIHMSGINGFEMMKEILTLKPSQLFIVMTSFDTDKNLISSIHEGACSFLRKPIDIKELQTAILMTSGRIEQSLKQLSPDITIDSRKEVIYKDKEPIFLTHKNHKNFFGYCAITLGDLVTYEMFEKLRL